MQALFEICGYRAASISIDDFYLTHADQKAGRWVTCVGRRQSQILAAFLRHA